MTTTGTSTTRSSESHTPYLQSPETVALLCEGCISYVQAALREVVSRPKESSFSNPIASRIVTLWQRQKIPSALHPSLIDVEIAHNPKQLKHFYLTNIDKFEKLSSSCGGDPIIKQLAFALAKNSMAAMPSTPPPENESSRMARDEVSWRRIMGGGHNPLPAPLQREPQQKIAHTQRQSLTHFWISCKRISMPVHQRTPIWTPCAIVLSCTKYAKVCLAHCLDLSFFPLWRLMQIFHHQSKER